MERGPIRIGLLVDAGCDLPEAMLAEGNAVVLPIAVRNGHYLTDDSRNDEATRQFLESDIAKDAADAENVPYTVEQIRELFLGRLVHEYDHHEIREAGGNKAPFALRVQNTANLFAS